MNKTRDISPYDYLQALQKEYICLEIRSKIYIAKADKDYFKRLMEKKEQIILAISKKNNIPNVVENDLEYLKVWKEIVPQFGFPSLIYNVSETSEAKMSFPYKGSVIRVDGRYGISNKVNFTDNTVEVTLVGETETRIYKREKISRLKHEATDEYYYYSTGNKFNTESDGIGTLLSYDMTKKEANISFGNEKQLILSNKKIARIL